MSSESTTTESRTANSTPTATESTTTTTGPAESTTPTTEPVSTVPTFEPVPVSELTELPEPDNNNELEEDGDDDDENDNDIVEKSVAAVEAVKRSIVFTLFTPFIVYNATSGESQLLSEANDGIPVHGANRFIQSLIDLPFMFMAVVFDLNIQGTENIKAAFGL